jgi:hypothetical protein
MQDDPATNTLVLCVLDGHGEHGDAVSASFREQLAAEMFNHPVWATDVKKASADAIAKIEHSVIRNFRIDTEFSGTTLSMAIIRGNHLTGVNIGDSRVILAREEAGRLAGIDITYDHKPDSPKEKERIISCGGRVFAVEYDDGIDGPPRVWLGHMDVPGLAMSRYVDEMAVSLACCAVYQTMNALVSHVNLSSLLLPIDPSVTPSHTRLESFPILNSLNSTLIPPLTNFW